MKKKILLRFTLILIISSILIFSNFIPSVVNAESKAGINAPSSVNVGKGFNVSLILPSEAYAAEASVSVKYSDGTTATGKIVYMKGMDAYPNNISFSAKVKGTATITVSNIIISDSAGAEIEKGGSKAQNITIVDPNENNNNNNNPNNNNNGSNNNDGNNGSTPNTGTTPTNNDSTANTSEVKFTDVNEKVVTNDRVNLRESYSTSSKKITTVENGTELTRTGVGSNGWSKVNYNGQVGYMSSQYLTKKSDNTTEKPDEKEVEFKEIKGTKYATQNCNLRKSWSTDSDLAGYLTKGEEVTITGVADNGWTRLDYKGQTIYVATRLLTDEKPSEEPEEEEQEEPDEKEEKTELELLQESISVLPEVGENIITKVYIVTTAIVFLVATIVLYYIKKRM